MRLVYPEIQGGRVIADVEVPGLGDYFVGERTRVYVDAGTRRTLVVPASYVYRRAGVNYVRLAGGDEIVVQPGEARETRRRPRRRNPVGPQGRRHVGGAMKLGLSGVLTRTFINSPLTPLLLLAALVAGALAVFSLPREEEPQISVPMVDIMVAANGYKADEAVELVTRPLEDIVKGIDGVEHVYSQTRGRPGRRHRALLSSAPTRTPRCCGFMRRSAPASAIMPKGIPEPLIVGRGINDVAILVLTLSAKPDKAAQWTDNGLLQVAEELQHELTKVDGVGSTYIVGGSPSQIRVEPDPERLALYGITLAQVTDKLANANRSFLAGAFRDNGRSVPVVAGQTLQGVPDIGLLLADVARRPARLCQGRRRRRGRFRRGRASRLDDDAATRPAHWSGGPRSASRSPSARARTRSSSPTT